MDIINKLLDLPYIEIDASKIILFLISIFELWYKEITTFFTTLTTPTSTFVLSLLEDIGVTDIVLDYITPMLNEAFPYPLFGFLGLSALSVLIGVIIAKIIVYFLDGANFIT